VAAAGSGALVMGTMIAASSPASAASVSCGTVLVASATLTENLDCTGYTAGNALNIGADDVTVNLNGYEILGPGDLYNTDGIADVGYNDVTIEDGSFSNFDIDIELQGLTGAAVTRVKTTDNTVEYNTAVGGDYVSALKVQGLFSSDSYAAVNLYAGEDSTVAYSRLVSTFVGIEDQLGSDNTWAHNSIVNVDYAGIDLDEETSDVVKANTINGTGADGIEDEEGSGNTITKNTLNGLYDGVYSYGTGETVSWNDGSHDTYGIYSEGAVDATYVGNQFDSGEFGIETDYPLGELLEGNVTNHNSDIGVYVYTDYQTSGSAGTYAATVSDNVANSNRFGLYSQIATAGSGNHATANKVENCFNVSC
jgi:parallel beta-helix repeat protein